MTHLHVVSASLSPGSKDDGEIFSQAIHVNSITVFYHNDNNLI